MKKSIAGGSLFFLLLCAPALRADAIFTVVFDNSNALPDGTAYATITITFNDTSGDGKTAIISADVNNGVLNLNPGGGFQSFGLNPTDGSIDLGSLPTGWALQNGPNQAAFGAFLENIDTTGQYRQDPLVFNVVFTNGFVTGTSLFADFFTTTTSAEGITYFAGHIADFNGNPGSAYFGGSAVTCVGGGCGGGGGGGSVPEPGGLALLGSGMIGMATLLKRRQKK